MRKYDISWSEKRKKDTRDRNRQFKNTKRRLTKQ